MNAKKYAFTMIELILVIVILGILAAVALPRLSATRDDAIVSRLANNIMSGVSEIAAYAMSNSVVDNNLTVMSKAIKSMENTGDAIVSDNKAEIKAGSISDCVIISVDSNDTTGIDTLNIGFSSADSDGICLSLQSSIDASEYPMKLRGNSVVY